MTITESVRGLTIGDCPTRREAVKTIREYFENGDPVERIREEIAQEKVGYPPSADHYKAIMKCLQIIDKYREPQERSKK